MKTNQSLVESLRRSQVLKSDSITDAFLKIDRKDFVVDEYKDLAYVDTALPLPSEQTISQPYTVAFMLELLELKEGQEVLDIGSGSGWTTALLSEIVGKDGFVYAFEIVEELVEMGRKNIAKYDIENATISKATSEFGIPGRVFDRILVSASAKEIPNQLLEQLKTGGILVLPVSESIFKIMKKKDGSFEKEEHYGFVFVDLV